MKPMALAAIAGLLVASTVQAQGPPPACQGPEHRQFDFWVGRWDVFPTGQDTLVAHSLIEKLYGGCAIRENWMPLKGTGGGSLNAYVSGDKGWRQLWTDSSGAWAEFRGGWNGTAMSIQGDWSGTLTRMTYTPGPDGSVRQHGETSDDGGKTWKTSFDLTYRPSKPS